jgi:hypothetical protein
MESVDLYTKCLQASISPIVLISGVGLILLSLTNRLGRTIDRTRAFAATLESEPPEKKARRLIQMKILYRRSQLLQISMIAITFSIACSSFIVPVIFFMTLFQAPIGILQISLLFLSITGIIVSAITLLIEVTLALKALNHEVKDLV